MKKIFLIIQTLCVINIAFAKADIASRINSIINQPSQKNVTFAVKVIDASSGSTVFSRNAEQPMIPASNMKLVTSFAALKYLGPQYVYTTTIALQADSLVVIGSGDPLFADKDTDTKYNRLPNRIFDDVISSLKTRGVTDINNIVIDTTIFDGNQVHPNWPKDQLNRWYACEVSGLNFNDNCVDISAQTVGNKVTLTLEPKTNYVELVNNATPAAKSPSTIGFWRQQGANQIVAVGKCFKKTQPAQVAIEKPEALFGFVLAENLNRAGISVKGRLICKKVVKSGNFSILNEYQTPITDVLARCNKDSFGLAAESLLKTIAAQASPEKSNGSWESGRKVITDYLLSLGIPQDQFFIDDASGLSSFNKLSPNTLTTILFEAAKSSHYELFKNSLAVGGVDGTKSIRKAFSKQQYKGKVFAKSGTIDNAKSLSGFCNGQSGNYIFSIIANKTNGTSRDAINDIVKALLDSSSDSR